MRIINNQTYALLLAVFMLGGCGALTTGQAKHYHALVNQQEAIESIRALQAQYLSATDAISNQIPGRLSPEVLVASLYTDDGALIVYRGDEEVAYRGKEQLIDMLMAHEKSAAASEGTFTRHFSISTQIKVTGNKATNNEQFLVLHKNNKKKEVFWTIGRYVDTFEKNAGGEWRFKSKVAYIDDLTKLTTD